MTNVWIEKLTALSALPLGIRTIASNGPSNWISCTTKFVQRGNHIVGHSIFDVYVNSVLICSTPYLEFAIDRFENPEKVQE